MTELCPIVPNSGFELFVIGGRYSFSYILNRQPYAISSI